MVRYFYVLDQTTLMFVYVLAYFSTMDNANISFLKISENHASYPGVAMDISGSGRAMSYQLSSDGQVVREALVMQKGGDILTRHAVIHGPDSIDHPMVIGMANVRVSKLL